MGTFIDACYDGIGRLLESIYSYGPLADKTVVLVFPFVDKLVGKLSAAIGFDEETLCYTLGLFLCYPFGIIMHKLPYGKVRHIFSFVLGVFLLQFSIGKQWVHHFITVVISYAFFLILPTKKSKIVVPAFVMIYLTAGHLHRQYVNYLGWDLGFHTTHMMLAIKLYSMAYNLYDGEILAKGITTDRAANKCSHFALSELPDFFEFLGYTFNFSTVLAGPAFEYATYRSACDGSNLYDKDGKPLGTIPSNVTPTLKPFVTGLVCMVTFVLGSKKFPYMDPTNAQAFPPVVLTDNFLQKSLMYRFAYSFMSLFFMRTKYYFAWKISEGACNVWYVGFEGFDQDGNVIGWEHSNNVDIIAYETAPNWKTLSAAWNKKTAAWLSKYVYFRTGGSLIATYFLSAFWHGFYPGYYLFFLSVPLLTICERLAFKKLSPRFVGSKWSGVYNVSATLATSFIVCYFVQPFVLLAFGSGLTNWKNLNCIGHIVLVVFYLVVSNIPTPKKKVV